MKPSARELAKTNYIASMISFGAAAFSSLGTNIPNSAQLTAIAFGGLTGVSGLYALLLEIHGEDDSQ